VIVRDKTSELGSLGLWQVSEGGNEWIVSLGIRTVMLYLNGSIDWICRSSSVKPFSNGKVQPTIVSFCTVSPSTEKFLLKAMISPTRSTPSFTKSESLSSAEAL